MARLFGFSKEDLENEYRKYSLSVKYYRQYQKYKKTF